MMSDLKREKYLTNLKVIGKLYFILIFGMCLPAIGIMFGFFGNKPFLAMFLTFLLSPIIGLSFKPLFKVIDELHDLYRE